MISRIINKFIKKQIKEQDPIVKKIRSKGKVIALENEIVRLKEELSKFQKNYPVIPVFVGDPSPTDVDVRKMYVAQVAGLHKDILEPKLTQLISNAHKLWGDTSNDREYDLLLKGAVYGYMELLSWGKSMINEQISNQNENNT